MSEGVYMSTFLFTREVILRFWLKIGNRLCVFNEGEEGVK